MTEWGQRRHIEAQVQGRGVGEDAESRHNKRPFKNELRDALTVVNMAAAPFCAALSPAAVWIE